MSRPGLWQSLRNLFGAAPEITSEQLADASATRRWRSVRALGASTRPALLPDLFRLLADPDPIVRDETTRTLASWGSDYSLKPAVDLLSSGHPSPELAASVLDLLALLADPGIRPLAAPYLSASDPLLRLAAARALGAAGSENNVSDLFPLVTDPDPRVRRAACLALGSTADASALPVLLNALDDKDPPVRQFARQSSTRIEAELARRQRENERAAARQARRTKPPGSSATHNSQDEVVAASSESPAPPP